MSGLVYGLQNRLQQFESATDLKFTSLSEKSERLFFVVVVWVGGEVREMLEKIVGYLCE